MLAIPADNLIASQSWLVAQPESVSTPPHFSSFESLSSPQSRHDLIRRRLLAPEKAPSNKVTKKKISSARFGGKEKNKKRSAKERTAIVTNLHKSLGSSN